MHGDQCLAEAGKHFQRIADRGALALQQLIPFAFTGTIEFSDNAVMCLDGDAEERSGLVQSQSEETSNCAHC